MSLMSLEHQGLHPVKIGGKGNSQFSSLMSFTMPPCHVPSGWRFFLKLGPWFLLLGSLDHDLSLCYQIWGEYEYANMHTYITYNIAHIYSYISYSLICNTTFSRGCIAIVFSHEKSTSQEIIQVWPIYKFLVLASRRHLGSDISCEDCIAITSHVCLQCRSSSCPWVSCFFF